MTSSGAERRGESSATPAAGGPGAAWPAMVVVGLVTASAIWAVLAYRAVPPLLGGSGQLAPWVRWGAAPALASVVLLLVLFLRLLRSTERARDALAASQAEGRAGRLDRVRLDRLHSALREVNRAVGRTAGRADLFNQVCRLLVETGGFRTAWIAWHDPESERLLPVAQEGADVEYVRRLVVHADGRPEGQGPSGIAFRAGEPCICRDALVDPLLELWRDAVRQSGFRASASIPIPVEGTVRGVLNVYSAEVDPFGPVELRLLDQVAEDLSSGLVRLDRDEAHRQAEDRAEAERRFSEMMIQSMPGVLYMYDTQGRFLRWNRNLEETTGYEAEELAEMHPLQLFAPEDRGRVGERIEEVFRSGNSSVEAPFLSRDGRRTPHFFTGRLVSFGGEQCLVGVGIDVSDRVRAEEERREAEARFRTTLDNVLEGCQVIGSDWTYLYLNRAAAVHNRRPNEELLGRRMTEVWPGIEASPVFRLLARCMEEGIALHEETEFHFPDGTSGWFDVRAQPVPEGIFVLSIDISERHAAEAALRRLNETLEETVQERTGELQEALVRAESADRAKSAFLAAMSHELRTPLNSIIGFTGIVLQGLAGPLTEEQTRQLGMVRSSSRHLLDLINDLLDLSKIEAEQLGVRREELDVEELVNHVAATVRPLAEARGLELEVEVPPEAGRILGDRRRVQQVLLNLVNNGIKFTDTGGVTVRVERGDGQVRLQVRDTGIGIREEDLGLLFQPFSQIDSGLARQHEGTGLGLAICRRLARLMGGDVVAHSEWGRGSEFVVILPADPGGGT